MNAISLNGESEQVRGKRLTLCQRIAAFFLGDGAFYDGLDITVATYGDNLRALALGGDEAKKKLDPEVSGAMKLGLGGLSQLMAIESQLMFINNSDELDARYWWIRDRFSRIASQQAQNSYTAWSSGPTARIVVPSATAPDPELATLVQAEAAALATLNSSIAAVAAATAAKAAAEAAATNPQLEELAKAVNEATAAQAAAMEAYAAAVDARLKYQAATDPNFTEGQNNG